MVADKLKIDAKIVEKVNKTYWKEIVKSLTSVTEQPIHIKKIGTIEASPYKTSAYIRYLLFKIRRIKASTKYTEETRERLIRETKEALTKLLKKHNQFATQRYNELDK